ncbi:MAG: NF038129 family PEP-CTERM protein [Candidatus Accumulibacter sp.]|nr:NF038129 family PEP-CTERM protein [Accumulibacter sp.]
MAFRTRLRQSILALAISVSLSGNAQSAFYDVVMDTTGLSGSAAQLAVDLVDGDGTVNNTLSISGFTTDGSLGGVTLTGGASGSLSAGAGIADTDFFNEFLQGLTLGNSIRFRLDSSSNLAAGAAVPDRISVFLLDSAGLPLVTTTLLGDALFTLDLDGSADGLLDVTAGTNPPLGLSVKVPDGRAPEPGSDVLLLLGLAFAVAFGKKQVRERG